MSKRLKRVWVSEEAHNCLKLRAAKEHKKMSEAFDDLVKDSKDSRDRWGRLF